jgi:peptidoglycan hydrolase-like protein with peptidoglycan-binding domain
VLQRILTALAISAIACSSLAATPAKPHKRRHPVAATSTTARKHTVAASTKTSKAAARHKGKIARRPVRSYQQAPTPDRYREIQQALVSKGYYKGEPNGEWGADSSDALKRFQADQNLMPDGKINSLSLIALGLGPKRLTAKSDAAPPSQVAPPVSPSVAPVK